MHGADIQDRNGAKGVLKRSRARFPFVELAYVDGGYAGRLVRWAKNKAHIVLEVVKRRAEQVGFAVIRRRWVVERTFAWIVKNRRLVRDYEQLTTVAETLITVAAIGTLIRRWPKSHPCAKAALLEAGARSMMVRPEPEVLHAQDHWVEIRAQEHAGDLRSDHHPHRRLLP